MEINIESIKKYFSTQKDVVCAYIFGSFAKGKQNLYSDLDIAVLLNPYLDQKEYVDRQIAIMIELSRVLDVETDIIIINRANTFLKFQIFKYGKRIYERKDRKNRAFEAKALLEYFDFLPIRILLESGLIRKIKEV